jgi:hypothetical protein
MKRRPPQERTVGSSKIGPLVLLLPPQITLAFKSTPSYADSSRLPMFEREH